jgi:hypothetical protein
MQSNAGMAKRQGDVDWHFVQVLQLEFGLAWLGLEEMLRQVSARQLILVSSLSGG